jgi:hypothetical protein
MEPVLLTELQDSGEPTPPAHMQIQQVKASSEHNAADLDYDEFEEDDKTNQIFNVKDAVPPNDYDAPYS